jgi:hypothetical protein
MPLLAIVASTEQIDLDLGARLETLFITRHDDETVGPCDRGQYAGAAGPERLDLSFPHQ